MKSRELIEKLMLETVNIGSAAGIMEKIVFDLDRKTNDCDDKFCEIINELFFVCKALKNISETIDDGLDLLFHSFSEIEK